MAKHKSPKNGLSFILSLLTHRGRCHLRALPFMIRSLMIDRPGEQTLTRLKTALLVLAIGIVWLLILTTTGE